MSFDFQRSPHESWFDIWSRWDAGTYQSIATQWYSGGRNEDERAFFSHFPPLFPGVLLLASKVCFFLDMKEVALLVSFVSGLLAMLLLFRLLEAEGYSMQACWQSTMLYACFPTAYFLFVPYSEGLFLLLVIASFYTLRVLKNFPVACLIGTMALLTRNVGWVVFPVFTLSYLNGLRTGERKLTDGVWLATFVLGICVVFLINYLYYDDFLFSFKRYQKDTASINLGVIPFREPVGTMVSIIENPQRVLNRRFMMTLGWGGLFIWMSAAVLLLGIRRVALEYWLYGVFNLLLISSLTWGIANARYVLSVFPIFMVLGQLRWRMAVVAIAALFMVLQIHFSVIFVGGGWAF